MLDGPPLFEIKSTMSRSAPILVPLTGNTICPGVEPTILLGDAYDLFGRVAPESVNLVITSPPYWGHRSYGLPHNWDFLNDIEKVRKIGTTSPGYGWYRENGGILGLEPYPEWYVQHLVEILAKARRCLKADGNVWINIGDTYFARWASIRDGGRQGLGDPDRLRRKTPMGGFRQEKQLLMIPARFAIAMQNDGWILRNDMIWHKEDGREEQRHQRVVRPSDLPPGADPLRRHRRTEEAEMPLPEQGPVREHEVHQGGVVVRRVHDQLD